jgi:spore coat protein A
VNDLLIAPGERYMVVVDFTGHSGSWVLSNDARAPFPAGDPTIASIPQIMRFDVGETPTGVDRSVILPVLAETNNNIASVELSLQQARLRTLQAAEPALMPGMPMLGTSDSLLQFRDKVTETPQLGSTEAWALRNHSPDAHPIHEHLVELQLVGRWPVTKWSEQDATGSAVPVKVGKFQPAGAFESGPKDTFVSPPDTITVWVGKYTIGTDGVSVWHCHILSHEDNARAPMMRPLAVGTAEQTQLPMVGTLATLDALVRPPYQP